MRPQAILLRLCEVLPRHWTPSDANGARRWGLSFGAGLLLCAFVGAFVAYTAIDGYEADDAWTRPNIDRTDRTDRTHRVDRTDGMGRALVPANGGSAPRDRRPIESRSEAVERFAPVARADARADARAPAAPIVPALPTRAQTTARGPLPSAAQAVSASKHRQGQAVRHSAGHRPRHTPPAPRALPPHAPPIIFTLPHFLTEPMRMQPFPHPPSPSFDLSDNQRALYRGH